MKSIFEDSDMFQKEEWSFINDPKSYRFRESEEIAIEYLIKHELLLDYFKDLSIKAVSLLKDFQEELSSRIK